MSGLSSQTVYDAGERKFTFVRVQDIEPYLEENKRLRALEQKNDAWRHTSSIPNIILMRWLNEEHARGRVTLRLYTREFDEIIHKKLQDPDWAYLRTDGVRHRVGYGDS